MSDNFDITKVLEGLSPEESIEFLSHVLTPKAKTEFLAEKETKGLAAQYENEINSLNTRGMSQHEKLNRINAIKKSYREKGLGVY